MEENLSISGTRALSGRKIINRDIIASEHVKLALMTFGEGTGLTEHAAPGEALVMALEGKAIITYEGKDHPIKAGESFVFEKAAAMQ